VLRPISFTSGEPIFLFTHAFKVGVGAWDESGPAPKTAIPASFHSQRFATIQLHYPVHEFELLVIVDAVKTF
jgi:hypothetical protein